ncbi:hypothetical protein RUM44_003057 [Polyplax serrata]|uniref:Methyltransferase-like protein 22 n=1 Tax=Polyplax serrata TaxID=468196 RepID=A0ABR1AXJ0_POLSC
MSDEEQCKITSEIFPFFDRDTSAKPLLDDKNVISKFRFSLPCSKVNGARKLEKDEDGDYILERGVPHGIIESTIVLEHSVSTVLKLVGLQIWRASLLLADFVIHSQDIFLDKNVLELGSGVGLTSIVAAIFASQVTCTDLDAENILNLLESNIKRNKNLLKGQIYVKGLNFFNLDWSSDLTKRVEESHVIIAADVIYDNDVTEAFVKTITKILSTGCKKTLFLGLEKRYVFTISDLDSVAPCFEHYKFCIEKAQTQQPFSDWDVSEVPIDFPQYFNYERTRELVLFRISS